MATKITFIGAAPSVTTGADVVNAGPQTPSVADQNLANIRAAVDSKMPLAGSAGQAFSVGVLTQNGLALLAQASGSVLVGTADSTMYDTNAGPDMGPTYFKAKFTGGGGSSDAGTTFSNSSVSSDLGFWRNNSDGKTIRGATVYSAWENNTAGSEACALVFATMSGGARQSEKMRISPAGNVLINTAVDNASGALLQVSGGISASALPVYADNTAAAALVAGTMYRTLTGTVMIKY